MAVPAHDERDFEFAKAHGLPVKQVVRGDGDAVTLPYTDEGVLVNSGELDGLSSSQGRTAVMAALSQRGAGGEKVTYKLRDWVGRLRCLNSRLTFAARYSRASGTGESPFPYTSQVRALVTLSALCICADACLASGDGEREQC